MIPMTSATAGMPTSVPAFIAKLWHMVSDVSCDDLICWSEDGTSFVIKDQARFCSHLLPRYYKHNNMASFIRQLNKYGFHKVSSIESSSLRNDKGDFEFAHEFFVRGCVKSLEMIKRKMTTTSREVVDIKGDMAPVLQQLLLHVQELKDNHETLESKIDTMKRENDALWREHSLLRQKYVKQQKMINQVINFLVTLVQQRGVNVNRGRGVTISLKDLAQAPLMAIEAKKKDSPIIFEIPAEQVDSTADSTSNCTVKGDEPLVSPSTTYVINSPVDASTIIEQPDTSTVLLNPASPAEPATIEIAASPLGTPGYAWVDVPSSSSGIVLGSPVSPSTLGSPTSSRGANLLVCPQDVTPAIITREYLPNAAFKNTGKASSNKPKSKGAFNVVNIKQEKPDPLLSTTVTDNLEDQLSLDADLPGPVGSPESKNKTKDSESSLVRSDPGTRQDVESHLDVVQGDLDSLKDILQNLDASAFMSWFNDQDPLGLNMTDGSNNQQLVSLNPNTLIDISDMLAEEETDPLAEPVDPLSIDSSAIDSLLNTPQPTPSGEPLFNQPKRLRK